MRSIRHHPVIATSLVAFSILIVGAMFWQINVAKTQARTAAETASKVSIAAAKQQIAACDWTEAASFIDKALDATPDRADPSSN